MSLPASPHHHVVKDQFFLPATNATEALDPCAPTLEPKWRWMWSCARAAEPRRSSREALDVELPGRESMERRWMCLRDFYSPDWYPVPSGESSLSGARISSICSESDVSMIQWPPGTVAKGDQRLGSWCQPDGQTTATTSSRLHGWYILSSPWNILLIGRFKIV